MLDAFFTYFFWHIRPDNLHQVFGYLDDLIGSWNLYFWLIVMIPVARFQLPPLTVWLVSIVRRRWLFPPLERSPAERRAFVSVVIAGRNESASIDGTIATVLRSGYPNLEIVFVDDASEDQTFAIARRYRHTGRVRAFTAPLHSGKPTCLNIGIARSKGEFVYVIDADSELEPGAIEAMLAHFADPAVGAVAGNIRVINNGASLITRIQEAEYALNVTLARTWRARLDFLPIVAGASGMFRRRALDAVGFFDTGLGDDTDMTLRLRKAGWKLRFAPYGTVWTDVPVTFPRLARQRIRWERNMVKIRIRKHYDLLRPDVFGLLNALLLLDILLFRLVYPLVILTSLVVMFATQPFATPVLLTFLYWITATFSLFKLLICNDLFENPPLVRVFFVAPLVPIYRLTMRVVLMTAILKELARIQLRHGYVPERVWSQIPHW